MIKSLLTALWILIVATLSLLLLLLPLDGGLLNIVVNALESVSQYWQFSLLFALLAGLSLWLFFAQFKRSNRESTPSSVVIQVDDGEVRISLTAIETLIHQAAGQIKGVREVRTSFFSRQEGLGVAMRIIVATEGSIPELSAQLQVIVKDHVYRIAGIAIEEVKVLVDNVANVRNRVELR